MTNQKEKQRAILAMVACACLWSMGGIFIKVIPWHPVLIASVRSLISAAVFYLYMKKEGHHLVWNRTSLWGGIFLAAVFLLFVSATKLTTSANAIVLQFTNPVFILLFSVLFLKQKPRGGDIATVTMTLFGISLFFLDQLTPGNLLGNLIAILSGVCFGAMFVITGHASEEDRMSGILLGHLFTAAAGIPFLFLTPPAISPLAVGGILVLGIVQLGIPYILYGIAAKHCSPLTCSLIAAIEPLLNPVWVLLFYGEVPGFYALIGAAVVLASVLSWIIWSQKQGTTKIAGE